MYSLEVQHFIFRISHKRFQKTLPFNSKLGQPYSVWDWRQNKKSLLAFLKVHARGKIIYHAARLSFAIKTNQVDVSELLEQFGVVYTQLYCTTRIYTHAKIRHDCWSTRVIDSLVLPSGSMRETVNRHIFYTRCQKPKCTCTNLWSKSLISNVMDRRCSWRSHDNFSLRGRRLKGKGKGVWGARETRWGASRVSLAPKTPFPFPFKRLPRRLW